MANEQSRMNTVAIEYEYPRMTSVTVTEDSVAGMLHGTPAQRFAKAA